MSFKSRKKKFETNPQEIALLLNLDIKSLSAKYMPEVVIFVGKDEQSNNNLNNLKSISENKKAVAYATIITYEETLDLLNNFEPTDLPENLEKEFRDVLTKFQSFLEKGSTLTPMMLAYLYKIKLVDVIYKQNAAEKDRKLRMKAFEEELSLLTKDCRPANKLKSVLKKQSVIKDGVPETLVEKPPTTSKVTLVDEHKKPKLKGELTQTESFEDLVFDDDIITHIWYYIFQGIEDPELVKYLINNLNLIITAIVQVKLHFSEEDQAIQNTLDRFWNQTFEYLFGSNRQKQFENTVLMKYESEGMDYEETYEELIFMLRNLWKIKWWHLHYLRHTNIVPIKGTYPFVQAEYLYFYNNVLKYIPSELATPSVIFSSLLQEIMSRVDRKMSILNFSELDLFANSNGQNNDECLNPMLLSNMAKYKGQETNLIPKTTKHLFYENNIFDLIMKFYNNNIGNLTVNRSLDVVKIIKPFCFVNNFPTLSEIPHKHDKDPLSSRPKADADKMLHFMYLFLFSLFNENDCKLVQKVSDVEELTKNLDVYNKEDWQRTQVLLNDPIESNIKHPDNFYETALPSFVWREKLSSDVLIQEILQAQEEYHYGEIKYCPESEKYLILFSDHLDHFGLNVRFFDQSLSTPVCLRDFCKYTTVLKSDFLSRHKPPTYNRKTVAYLNQGLNSENDEYMRLLSSCDSNVDVIETIDAPSLSFQELLTEIREYPTNNTLTKETAKFPGEESIDIFDIGTQFVSVIGTTTTFVSHDGVKIVVDNTRFINEPPKCTVKLSCNRNDIVLHSSSFYEKNNYSFHITLQDGSLITFFVNDYAAKLEKQVSVPEITPQKSKEGLKQTSYLNLNKLVTNLKDVIVVSTDQKDAPSNIDLCPSNGVPRLDVGTVIRTLKNVKNVKFYKTHEDFKLISPVNPSMEIPLINLLDRFVPTLNDIPEDDPQPYSKRLVSTSLHSSRSTESSIDFRISLPNGLYLSCVSSINSDKNLFEVKQEFLSVNDAEEVFEEEFRLFTRDGFVLVKKLDGVISIYKCSGEQILFEKPDSVDEKITKSNLKKCHCKSKDDYRKKLLRVMNDNNEDQEYFSSRRGNLRTKKGYVIDSNLLEMVKHLKIPFKKTSIIKFTGHKTSLEGNKVTQKRSHCVTREYDYSAQETYFERSDDFKALFGKTGTLSVKFSDGTVITSSVYVKDELVDGYVYVSLNISYEHPKYLTVSYDLNSLLTVELNNDVILTRDIQNHYKLLTGSDTEMNIDMNSVRFRKTCNNCRRKYKCDFNIQPLVSKTVELSGSFVNVRDTYDKKFYVDFAGNCQHNNDFVERHTNNFACNHVKRNMYKKLFVFDRNLTGERYWSESMVEMEKNQASDDGKVKEGLNFDKRKVIRIVKNHYETFAGRFCNNSLKNKVMLSKYRQQIQPELEYCTYRVFTKMMEIDEIELILEELRGFFNGKTGISNKLKTSVDNLLGGCEKLRKFRSLLSALEESNNKSLKKKCTCITIRRTTEEKISAWREQLKRYKEMIRVKNIPNYFDSQFCHKVEK